MRNLPPGAGKQNGKTGRTSQCQISQNLGFKSIDINNRKVKAGKVMLALRGVRCQDPGIGRQSAAEDMRCILRDQEVGFYDGNGCLLAHDVKHLSK